jgi:LEA14-like dessication related protein
MKRLTNFYSIMVITALALSPLIAKAILVPDFTGMTVDSVRLSVAELTGTDVTDTSVADTGVTGVTGCVPLVVLPDSFYTDSITEGLVGWQRPLPDSALIDSVKVRLATPLTIELPDIRGMKLLEAQEYIEGLGLVFFPARQMESEEYPPGTIAKTYPPGGSMVQRGDPAGIAIVTSIGVSNPTPTTTSDGVEIHRYGIVEFFTSTVTLVSSDSTGFELEFTLKVTNPYKHSIEIEKPKFDLQINRAPVAKAITSDASLKLPPKASGYFKLRVPVSYTNLVSSTARYMLIESEYRLVGTYALVAESGFSRKNFNSLKEAVVVIPPQVKKHLDEIISPPREQDQE